MKAEHQSLLLDNWGVAVRCMNNLGISDEDVRDELLVILCENIHKYDEKRGSISTFIYHVIRNGFYNQNRLRRYDKRIINEYAGSIETGTAYGVPLVNIVAHKDNNIDIYIDCDSIMQTLTEKEVKVIRAKMQGYTNKDICKICNCSPQNVSNIMNNARKKLIRAGVYDRRAAKP